MRDRTLSVQEFQAPDSPILIAASLCVALLLNWLPWQGIWLEFRPDFLALALLYWCTHKPLQVGIGTAWMLGILADVADASFIGHGVFSVSILWHIVASQAAHVQFASADTANLSIAIACLCGLCRSALAAARKYCMGILSRLHTDSPSLGAYVDVGANLEAFEERI